MTGRAFPYALREYGDQDSASSGGVRKRPIGSTGRPHVDALTRLEVIDGYSVSLHQGGSGDVTETVGYNE